MKGPPPKPTAVKRLEGNPGKRRLNTREPHPPPIDASFDRVPTELERYPVAVATWTELVPMLRQCRQMTRADRHAVMALCLEWSRYLEGFGRKGKKTGAQQAFSHCLRLWVELGLTPSSRSRLQVSTASGPGPDGDAFSEFDDAPGSRPSQRAH